MHCVYKGPHHSSKAKLYTCKYSYSLHANIVESTYGRLSKRDIHYTCEDIIMDDSMVIVIRTTSSLSMVIVGGGALAALGGFLGSRKECNQPISKWELLFCCVTGSWIAGLNHRMNSL